MRLFHREYGDRSKPTVVILHGLFGISDNWVSYARRLSEDYHLMIPDQRNHGQSPHCDIIDYPTLTEDLYEFINEHNLEDPFLLGHSMGGKVVMNFALQYPELVPAIIVADISMRPYHANRHHEKFIAAMRSVDFSNIKYRSEIDENLSDKIGSSRIRQFLLKNIYRDNSKQLNWRLNIDGIEKNLPKIFEGIMAENTFDQPALIVRGGKSPYVSDEDFTEMKKAFTAAAFETIEGATHWLHADKAEEFFAVTKGFLDKQTT